MIASFLEEASCLFHLCSLLLGLGNVGTGFLISCGELDRDVFVILLIILMGFLTINFISAGLFLATVRLVVIVVGIGINLISAVTVLVVIVRFVRVVLIDFMGTV